MTLPPIKTAHYPFAAGNPYQALMIQGLAQAGVTTVALPGSLPGLVGFLLGRHPHRVLHLHWLCGLVTGRSLAIALGKLCVFHFALRAWRLRGRKIVWTVHNLANHEHKRLWLDNLNSRLTARAAHALLVHGERARRTVMQTFDAPADKIHVIHHGNYSAMLPKPISLVAREGVRFLCFGAIRPYKGIGALLTAFGDLRGPHTLHIAGAVSCTAFATEINRQAARDPRVRLTLEFIPDEKLAHYLAECDVVVLPYLDILTSGSMLMALSAARPSIAPRLGIIEDYTRDDISFLYDVADPQGLAGALHYASTSQDLPERSLRAQAQSQRFDWRTIGLDLAHLYQQISV